MLFLCMCMTPCATFFSALVTTDIKVPFLLLFFSSHLYTSPVIAHIAFFPLALLWRFFSPLKPVVGKGCLPLGFFLIPQMNLPYLSWASQSAMTSPEGVPVILPHHQAAPALPLDQSCLPEESASAARAHSGNSRSRSSSSHHSSPPFSNTMPEFMESVIDSVSATSAAVDCAPCALRVRRWS